MPGKYNNPEVAKFAEKSGKVIGRVFSGKTFKPQEVSSIFRRLIMSPKAKATENLTIAALKKALQSAQKAIEKHLEKQLKEIDAIENPETRKLALGMLQNQRGVLGNKETFKELRKIATDTHKKSLSRSTPKIQQELQNYKGWGGTVSDGLKNLVSSKKFLLGVPVAGVGYGIYKGLAGNNEGILQETSKEEPESKYRFHNGLWEEYENNKWSPQEAEFGVDRNGNVNYYDKQTGSWLGDYIQKADGSVYSRDGRYLGNAGIDSVTLGASGYDNIFDYNAKRAGIDPSQVEAVQNQLKKFGFDVDVDGKWGAKTQAAYERAIQAIMSLYDPGSIENYFNTKLNRGY